MVAFDERGDDILSRLDLLEIAQRLTNELAQLPRALGSLGEIEHPEQAAPAPARAEAAGQLEVPPGGCVESDAVFDRIGPQADEQWKQTGICPRDIRQNRPSGSGRSREIGTSVRRE